MVIQTMPDTGEGGGDGKVYKGQIPIKDSQLSL